MVRELTHVGDVPRPNPKTGKIHYVRQQSARADRADLYTLGKIQPSGDSRERIACPLLDEEEEYVGFCGNLRKRRGQGYRLTPWLLKGGYENTWKDVWAMCQDMQRLEADLGIKVVGRHHASRRWYGLAEIAEMTTYGHGQKTLQAVMLRFYAPSSFLTELGTTSSPRGWASAGCLAARHCPLRSPRMNDAPRSCMSSSRPTS